MKIKAANQPPAYTKVDPQWAWQNWHARIAFVGEAPSDEELHEGAPLVGASGRTMGQLLRTAGLVRTDTMPRDFYPELAERGLRPLLWERSQFHWTNVFDEKLPDNEVKSWCAPAPEAHKWSDYDLDPIARAGFLRPAYSHHLERLRRELLTVQPTLIVPLGGTALWAFTGDSDIMAKRGAVDTARYLMPGVKLLPTLHPAGVIYQHKMFSVVVSDLEKAWAESQFPDVRLPKREVWVEPTLEDLETFKARYIKPGCLLSTDIETAGGQITCIGFAPSAERAIVVPFVDYRKPSRSYWATADDELRAQRWVQDILEDPTIFKMFQNGPYDIYWLWRAWRIKVMGYLHDTRLMHHALYPELPKSLQFMGATYGNQFAWKQMRNKKDNKRDG